MAAKTISLIPEQVDLQLYGGDGVELEINVSNGSASPFPLDGEVAAQIRGSRVNPDSMADFAVDMTNADIGIVIVSLTGDQSASLHGDPTAPIEKFKGVWDVQWTPESGRAPVTLVQGNVESSLDVTRLG
jgi:hypothetical protein